MNENSNKINCDGIGTSLCGFYKVQVVDNDKQIVADFGWNKNLILNQGMNAVAVQYLANLNKYGLCGSGSRPNSISGGDSIISQSGNIVVIVPGTGLQNFSASVTSSAGEIYYSSSLQTGDVIIYANSSQSIVVRVDSGSLGTGLSASVSSSYEIPSSSLQTFTIWKTAQVGLHKESRRSNTYLIGTGNCGTTEDVSRGTKTYRRTYDFPTETTNKVYTEIGVAWESTAGNSVFSRILLPEAVTISSSFSIRVIHDLVTTFSPFTKQIVTASITGWPVPPSTVCAGSASLQAFLASDLNTSGIFIGTSACFDPAGWFDNIGTSVNTFYPFLSPSTAAIQTFGTASNRTSNASVVASRDNSDIYISGSYTVYKHGTFDLNGANRSDLFSLGFGRQSSGNSWVPSAVDHQAYCLLFNQSQSKASTQTLEVVWKFSWSRVIQ